MLADTKSTSGRAFVRSLNILLKFARLYGFEHARTTAELVDGVVVGSRAVQVAADGPVALRDYVASLRAALDG